MSDVLEIARFDAGVQTADGYRQFSMADTAGSMIGNREYKEGFDKFKADCPCSDAYIWRVLSAVGDDTGRVLYENIKNYIDYVTNIDLCHIQALRSMVKMYGLKYCVFDRLDMLPVEILDLLNIFSINKKYVIHGNKILDEYRDRLSSEGVQAIYDYSLPGDEPPVSADVLSSVLDYAPPNNGKYYDFVVDSFFGVISGFLQMPYEEGGKPIYQYDGDDGIYDEFTQARRQYTHLFEKDSGSETERKEYERRQFKQLNGVPLQFDEGQALDRIESGQDSEEIYSGAKAELIRMEREWRARPFNENKTTRYSFYRRRRVLEYANFVRNKYFSDYLQNGLSVYSYDRNYFIINSGSKGYGSIESEYGNFDKPLIKDNLSEGYSLDEDMIMAVARSLADTAFYISDIREKLKLQTRKNYMKGTYNLMLYAVNEFLVDYSRLNPLFRSNEKIGAWTV